MIPANRRGPAVCPAGHMMSGKRHRLRAEKGDIDWTPGFARLGLGPADQRLELPIAQLDAIEFVVELADAGSQILLVDVRVEQRSQPGQPDDPVYPGRVVDPPEGIGRSEVNPLLGDGGQSTPRPVALQRRIEAGLLGDDDRRVPAKNLSRVTLVSSP